MGYSIKDVASLAKVSTSTVSHVINKTRKVNPETEKKVRDAIEKLNYELNPVARNLRSGSSKMIGYVIANLSNFFLDIGLIIDEILSEKGYQLIYLTSDENKQKEQENIKKLVMQSVDGLIIAPVDTDCSYMNQVIGDKCPCVFLDRKPLGYNRDFIMSTNSEGSSDGTEILLNKGHKRIGFVGSHIDGTMNERCEGYRSALIQHGLKPDNNLIKFGKEHSMPLSTLKHGECYNAAKYLVEEEKVTALFCGNDIASIGVICYLKEHNIQVPRDVDVVCFDDAFWLSLAYTSICSVDQDWQQIGKAVAEVLLSRLDSDDMPYTETRIPTMLVKR